MFFYARIFGTDATMHEEWSIRNCHHLIRPYIITKKVSKEKTEVKRRNEKRCTSHLESTTISKYKVLRDVRCDAAPLSQPFPGLYSEKIRFPRWAPFTYIYFEFWLVHCVCFFKSSTILKTVVLYIFYIRVYISKLPELSQLCRPFNTGLTRVLIDW